VKYKQAKGTLLLVAMAVTLLISTTSVRAAAVKPLNGQNLSVLFPAWGTLPKNMTDQFNTDTGITLDSQASDWDGIRTTVVTLMIANIAPPSSTEIDWPSVGLFGSPGWFQPLDGLVDATALKDVPTYKVFIYNDGQLPVPYSNDFRILIYNNANLVKAGITEAPKTPDEILDSARKIKAARINKHPIGLTLSATEGRFPRHDF